MNSLHLRIIWILAIACFGCSSSASPIKELGHGSTRGQIFVDTPEVFTRERIVNDRFDQVSWLEKQLRRADNPLNFGFQGLQQRGLALGLSVSGNVTVGKSLIGANANPGGASKGTDNAAQTNPGDKNTPAGSQQGLISTSDVANPTSIATTQANVTPIDNFRDMLAFREEVRTEMIETQLDDRHDIKGNTLYRLKFDSTILPEHDTSAWAVIRVRIVPNCSDDLKSCNTETQDKELYARWLTHVQKNVTNTYYSLVHKILNEEVLLGEDLQEILDFTGRKLRQTRNESEPYCPTETSPEPLFLSHDKQQLGGAAKAIIDTALEVKDLEGNPFYPIKNVKNLKSDQFYTSTDSLYVLADVLQRFLIERYASDYSPYKDLPDVQTQSYIAFCRGLRTVSVSPTPDGKGVKAFSKALKDQGKDVTIYSYAVTPKESVQRISDIGSRRELTNLLLTLSAISGTVQTSDTVKMVKETEGLYNAIQRQPLIVGFGDARGGIYPDSSPSIPGAHKSYSQLGWLIGPKFSLSPDGTRAGFRHTAIQNSLSASVSMPGWWSTVKIYIDACWLGEGVSSCESQPFSEKHSYVIKLPQDEAVLVNVLGKNKRRSPEVRVSPEIATFRIGEPGAVLLKGSEIWRSAVVTVGPWRSDRVAILPNMEGIVAEFEKETTASWSPTEDSTIPIAIWTSEGMQPAGKARIVKGIAAGDGIIAGIKKYVIGTPLQLTYSNTRFIGFSSLVVSIRKSSGAPAKNPWQDGSQITFKGPTLTTTITNACTGCNNGDVIDIGLKFKSTPNSDEQIEILKEHPVLYLSPDDAQARVKISATATGTPTLSSASSPLKLTLRFPAKSQASFPNFDPMSLILKASPDDGGPAVQITGNNCDVANEPIECSYTLRIEKVTANKTYSLTFSNAQEPAVKDKLIVGP